MRYHSRVSICFISKQEIIEFVNKIYAQIYPVEDERNYILSTIGSSITGQSKKDRNSLFLIDI
jgi:hypothetical protein